jgi:hypothetical protein
MICPYPEEVKLTFMVNPSALPSLPLINDEFQVLTYHKTYQKRPEGRNSNAFELTAILTIFPPGPAAAHAH